MTSVTGPKRRSKPYATLLLVPLLFGGCADAQQPDETPRKDGGAYNMIDPVPDPAWNETRSDLRQGNWHPERRSKEPALAYIRAGTPLLRVSCDGRRGLILDRLQAEPIGGVNRMNIRVGGESIQLAVNPLHGSETLRAAIPYSASVTSRLAEPNGKLVVSTPDAESLVAPLSEATRDFVLACRGAGRDRQTNQRSRSD